MSAAKKKNAPAVPDDDIQRIVDSYAIWHKADVNRTSTAAVRSQLKAVERAASRLAIAIAGLSPTAKVMLSVSPPEGILSLVETAKEAQDFVPKRWHDSAARQAASSLLALFQFRGLEFSATSGNQTDFRATGGRMGRPSKAVGALVSVARSAGDSSMTYQAARKWVEGAIQEHTLRVKGKNSTA